MASIKTTFNQHNLTAQCISRAAFFSPAHPARVMGLTYFFVLATVSLTIGLRVMAPPPRDPQVTTDTTTSTNTISARPDVEYDEAPPPYSLTLSPPPPPPPPYPEQSPALPRPFLRSSIIPFVLGTALFAGLLFSIIAVAFGIQYFTYCLTSDPNASVSFGMICLWFLYAWLLFFASGGFVAWCILLRSLWGAKVPEASHNMLVIRAFVLAAMPFVRLVQVTVAIIKTCQDWFCSQVLEEEWHCEMEMEGLLEEQQLAENGTGELVEDMAEESTEDGGERLTENES